MLSIWVLGHCIGFKGGCRVLRSYYGFEAVFRVFKAFIGVYPFKERVLGVCRCFKGFQGFVGVIGVSRGF